MLEALLELEEALIVPEEALVALEEELVAPELEEALVAPEEEAPPLPPAPPIVWHPPAAGPSNANVNARLAVFRTAPEMPGRGRTFIRGGGGAGPGPNIAFDFRVAWRGPTNIGAGRSRKAALGAAFGG